MQRIYPINLVGLAFLVCFTQANAGCASIPAFTETAPSGIGANDATQQATLDEQLGLAIPRYQQGAQDYFTTYGLAPPGKQERQLLASLGAVSPPIPGLSTEQIAAFHRGGKVFSTYFLPTVDGQGPLANSNSCAICHQGGGIGGSGHEVETRMGLVDLHDPNWMLNSTNFYDMPELGGPVQQAEGGVVEPLPTAVMVNGLADTLAIQGITVGRNVITSVRTVPTIAGDGLLSAISDQALIERENLPKPFGIKGHANRLTGNVGLISLDGKIGRLGWKAQLPDNEAFFNDAANQELGLQTPLNPFENATNLLPSRTAFPELTQDQADDTDAFCAGMGPIKPAESDGEGQQAFYKAGCAVCHYSGHFTTSDPRSLPASLQPYFKALGNKPVPAFSDLLVHNMGRGLADGFKQGSALGSEWRTTPLWGLRFKPIFLHNNLGTSLDFAIRLHKSEGSEANQVIDNYLGISTLNPTHNLTQTERMALTRFLEKL
jgi:CxxC motif-containing protein (DUF1111 family)